MYLPLLVVKHPIVMGPLCGRQEENLTRDRNKLNITALLLATDGVNKTIMELGRQKLTGNEKQADRQNTQHEGMRTW